jgi:hypothetical protein
MPPSQKIFYLHITEHSSLYAYLFYVLWLIIRMLSSFCTFSHHAFSFQDGKTYAGLWSCLFLHRDWFKKLFQDCASWCSPVLLLLLNTDEDRVSAADVRCRGKARSLLGDCWVTSHIRSCDLHGTVAWSEPGSFTGQQGPWRCWGQRLLLSLSRLWVLAGALERF